MKPNKKMLLALGVAAALGMSGAANAGVLASSTFSITNFLLSDNATGTTLAASDFNSLVATNNGGVLASLTGFTDVSRSFNLPLTDPNTDLARACVGGGCGSAPPENNFSVLTPPPGSQFSNADQLLAGSAITLGGPTAGANAQLRSDVSLIGTATGKSNADVGLNSTFLFSLTKNINIGVDFNGAVDLIAFADAGTAFPGNAQASSSLSVILTRFDNGATVFDFNNAGGTRTGCTLNRTLNRNAPFNGTSSYSCSDVFTATTGDLTAGTIYQLSIRQNANTNAQFVPEPGVISLIGLGLLGMGAALRKRKSA